MKYYSTMKRNELLIHKTTLMHLQRVMLSEESQSTEVSVFNRETTQNIQVIHAPSVDSSFSVYYLGQTI